MVHGHVWRTLCSVCATGARVVQPVPCNSSFVVLEVSPAPSPCCFNSLFHSTGTGRFENCTRWKPCKRVRSRGDGAWACLAHALQCLCDRRACCPPLAMQLVVRVGLNFPLDGKRLTNYHRMKENQCCSCPHEEYRNKIPGGIPRGSILYVLNLLQFIHPKQLPG
jgi:hypothetical protein